MRNLLTAVELRSNTPRLALPRRAARARSGSRPPRHGQTGCPGTRRRRPRRMLRLAPCANARAAAVRLLHARCRPHRVRIQARPGIIRDSACLLTSPDIPNTLCNIFRKPAVVDPRTANPVPEATNPMREEPQLMGGAPTPVIAQVFRSGPPAHLRSGTPSALDERCTTTAPQRSRPGHPDTGSDRPLRASTFALSTPHCRTGGNHV
jgi:hypothetical protein